MTFKRRVEQLYRRRAAGAGLARVYGAVLAEVRASLAAGEGRFDPAFAVALEGLIAHLMREANPRARG